LEEFGKVLFPVAGQFNEISRDFHDLIKFAAEDIAKIRFQTTTLPVVPHGAHWYHLQRVGMHLFRTDMAFKFDRLYLCLGFSHSTSYLPRPVLLLNHNRSMYTTTEQILHRWRRFTGIPFQFGSGSVATVVLWDRYACEL